MSRKIKNSVVVITGASSGIGRATAMALAEKGAYVVAAARRSTALEVLAYDCRDKKGSVLPVATDVTDEDAVEDLARRAIEEFGRIDVWLNNAAVSLFSRFEEAPSRAYRRVLETNLFGYVHGARSAIRRFREQGYGTLINVSSSVARGGSPYVSAYVTSKSAINGLTRCLRQELDDTDIQVCLVMPSSIDTPLFQQAANFTGRAVKPMDPVYDPERVSTAIMRLIKSPQETTYVGRAGRMLGAINRVSSPTYDKLMAKQVEKDHFQEEGSPPNNGNLFEPTPRWARVRGGWKKPTSRLATVAKAGLLMAVPAVAYLAWSNANGKKVSAVRGLLPG